MLSSYHAQDAADYSEYETRDEAAPDYQAEHSHRENDNAADCAISEDHQDGADDEDQPYDHSKNERDRASRGGTCRQWARVSVDPADPEEYVRPKPRSAIELPSQ